MIEFKRDLQGQINFCPDAEVLYNFAQKLAEAEQVLRLVADKGGLRLPGPLRVLARHPHAQLLTAYRNGLIGASELGVTPLELTHLSTSDIGALTAGQLLVAQNTSLLPAQESRGQSFMLASVDSRAEVQFRDNMENLSTVLGSSWTTFIGILCTITFVDVASMPGLPYFSGSSNVNFGAMHMIYSQNPNILAECITHEAAHTWLSLVDGQDRLARDMWNETKPWISPWREDLRPIGGVVHGVFVFSCVIVVLTKLLEEAKEPTVAAWIRKRLARIASQVEEGIVELRASGLLTEMGQQLSVESEARLRAALPLIIDEWEEARSIARLAYLRKNTILQAVKGNSHART